jgi:hypothetical protein
VSNLTPVLADGRIMDELSNELSHRTPYTMVRILSIKNDRKVLKKTKT